MRRIRPKKLIGSGIIIAAVLLGLIAILPITSPQCTEVHSKTGVLTISVAHLLRGQARRFCYRDGAGEELRFLLARGSDGKIRSVFDACRQCYMFHEGYKIEHGFLICRLCGNRYPIDHMTQGKASCVPVHLPHYASGSAVRIKVPDLESGAKLF